jgi:SIR2-like domain
MPRQRAIELKSTRLWRSSLKWCPFSPERSIVPPWRRATVALAGNGFGKGRGPKTSPRPVSSATMSAEFDWELLLDWLENQKVIPVIGQDLLYLQSEKGPVHLHQLIADRLITKHRVKRDQLPEDYTIADVACAVPDFGKDPQLVYSQVATAYKFVVNEQINGKLPEPIVQLARIPFFRLFVALTFDDLLERAIRLERRTDLHLIANEQHEVPDLTDQQKTSGLPIIFRMMGITSSEAGYALTDEDMLEFMFHLYSPLRRPKRLIDELCQNHLLVIGAGFPDWVTRFFLRATRGQLERLRHDRKKFQIIVDHHVSSDARLSAFLERVSLGTHSFIPKVIPPRSSPNCIVDAPPEDCLLLRPRKSQLTQPKHGSLRFSYRTQARIANWPYRSEINFQRGASQSGLTRTLRQKWE